MSEARNIELKTEEQDVTDCIKLFGYYGIGMIFIILKRQ